MTPNTVSVSQTIEEAKQAFHRGDRQTARQLAQMAAAIAPQREEPWLILAAISTPRASLEYIKQALLINPESERALRALRWAQDRLAREMPVTMQLPLKPSIPESVAVTQPTKTQTKPKAPRRKASGLWMFVFPILFLAFTCVALFSLTIWPGNVSRALALIGSEATAAASAGPIGAATGGPAWSAAEIDKATYTPIATATAIPTVTPTPTALPTDAPTAENTSIPAPAADNGKYILVSISEQHLYAYQDNQLVYSFIASTGMNNATSTGVFHVLDKMPNAYGSTWDLWMPNWMGIYYSGTLENGIHALPILSNGTQLWGGYLGTPISFGCIVLGVEEAQLLYNWADVGTTVEIKY
jgi:lipoprotein-anchoring transpeptidase ErfK/SrfK